MKRKALWELLVEKGLFADRRSATPWILTGKVLVNDRRVDKVGTPVPAGAEIRVKGLEQKYVGRGGLKLEGALADFGIEVSGHVVLDAGSSVGGFVDCLLQHGAAKVYAVEAGYGQLAGKLRADKRVVNMERTNIGDLSPEDLHPNPSLATVDLSYLSLKKAIPIIARLLEHRGEMICLVKPLFEVPDPEARRTGKLKDPPSDYRGVLCDLVRFVDSMGFKVVNVVQSRIEGSRGTKEFFLKVALDEPHAGKDVYEQIKQAVDSAVQMPPRGLRNE